MAVLLHLASTEASPLVWSAGILRTTFLPPAAWPILLPSEAASSLSSDWVTVRLVVLQGMDEIATSSSGDSESSFCSLRHPTATTWDSRSPPVLFKVRGALA